MSKVKIQGHASGTGVLTVTAPNTSTDRTITLPDGTGTLLTTDGDGSSLTGVGVDGISSSANATAITINSDESVDFANGIDVTGSVTCDGSSNVTNTFNSGSTNLVASFTSTDTEAEIQLIDTTGSASIKSRDDFRFFVNGGATRALDITSDGRGLSEFTAKAWVNYRGTSTNSIRDSHNVSSVTDNGTGDYTINFSNNIANSNYCVATSGSADQFQSTRGSSIGEYGRNSSYWRMLCLSQGEAGYSDHLVVHAVVFGD